MKTIYNKHLPIGRLIGWYPKKTALVTVDIKLYYNEKDQLSLTISGDIWNSKQTDCLCAGQIQDKLEEALKTFSFSKLFISTKKLKTLLDIWRNYHLNDMNPGTVRQMQALEKAGISGQDYDYDTAVKYLKNIGLYFDTENNNYQYGSAWLFRPLPHEVITFIKDLA